VKLTQRILDNVNDHFLNNLGLDMQRYRYDAVPIDRTFEQHGVDLLGDMSEIISNRSPVILDVGSFRGDAIRIFQHIWPKATITGFESDPELLAILHNHWDSVPGVEIVSSAVPDVPSTTQTHQITSNVMNLFPAFQPNPERNRASAGSIMVPTISLSDYCAASSITHVDLLNVATQGSELPVIQGAKEMLSEGAVRLVVIELTFDPIHGDRTRPSAVFSLLESLGYVCQGIFNQVGRSGQLVSADGLWRRGPAPKDRS